MFIVKQKLHTVRFDSACEVITYVDDQRTVRMNVPNHDHEPSSIGNEMQK
jgi:hypothetical protein